jgi:hypothetical protein
VDFVVIGFGLGALGVLLGVVMLGWLAPRSQRAATRVSSADDAIRFRAIAAEHRGTGQALLYAGGAMLLATVAGLMGTLDDRTGAFLVTTTATVAAVGILLGGYLQRARNPIPPRRRIDSVPAASMPLKAAPPPAGTPRFLTNESTLIDDPAPAERTTEESPAEMHPAGDSGEESPIVETMAPMAADPGASFSGATDAQPLDDAQNAAETTGSAGRQPTDHGANDRSGDTDLAEPEAAETVGYVAPSARATGSSTSRPDDDDRSSGHS